MDRICHIDTELKNTIVRFSYPLIFGGIGYAGYCYYSTIRNSALIKKKRKELNDKKSEFLKKLENLVTPINNMDKITSLKLSDLIKALEKEEFTPLDVLQAYQAKALIMDKEYNFITDLNPNAELDISNEATENKTLKNIPISLKECYMLKNCNCTYGMLDQSFNPVEEDEVIVQILRSQGLVPFVTTNLSQSCRAIESSNPVYGETLNPFNKTRTCGGSSGGEGAILGCGASLVGMGSDLGGSIRIPSHYCGVYGFRPTSSRISKRNCKCMFPYPNIVCDSYGPMARNIDDLVMIFKAMTNKDSFQLDQYCPPLCFDNKVFEHEKPLKIGYYIHLGGNQAIPVPAIERAVLMAKKALEVAGHTLVEFKLPDIDYTANELYFKSIFNDGGEGLLKDSLKNNPVDPCIANLIQLMKLPNIIKICLSLLIYPFNKGFSYIESTRKISSVHELWKFNKEVINYREKVLVQWEKEGMDGIICPVLPICAPPLHKSKDLFGILAYTSIYNLLDYPAGSTPVTKVNQNDIDELLKSYPRNTKIDRQIFEYQKDSIGMPIGVQSVAMMWRDEICLRIMKDIATNIN